MAKNANETTTKKEVKVVVNLKLLMLALGYTDKSWKSQKSRLVKLALGLDGADVFELPPVDALKLVRKLASGKSKQRGQAIDMLMKLEKNPALFNTPYVSEKKNDDTGGKKSLKEDLIKALNIIDGHVALVVPAKEGEEPTEIQKLAIDIKAVISGLTL